MGAWGRRAHRALPGDTMPRVVRAVWLPTLVALLVGVLLGLAAGLAADPLLDFRHAGPGGAARVEAALREPDRLRRIAELERALQRAEPSELAAVLGAFRAAPLNPGDVELALMIQWWGAFDPPAAHQWTRSNLRGRHPRTIAAAYDVWARSDGRAAIEESRKIRSPYLMAVASRAAATGFVQGGGELRELLPSLEPGPDLDEGLGVTASAIARARGVDAALFWAEQLEEVDGHADLPARAVAALAVLFPERSAAWMLERQADAASGVPGDLLGRVGERWAEQDPEATMAWLARLAPGADRDVAVIRSYRAWLSTDPRQARSWMRSHVEAPPLWLEAALAEEASYFRKRDPEEGLGVIANLSNPVLQEQTRATILRSWLAEDPDAAGQWIERADLRADERARLRALEPLEPARPRAKSGRAQPPEGR